MARPTTKLTQEQQRIVKHGAQQGLGAAEVRRQLAMAGLKTTLPTVGRWLQRQGGQGKRPTLGVPRVGRAANGAGQDAPGPPSAEVPGGSEGVEPQTAPVDVRSAEDAPEVLKRQLTELQAQLRIHSKAGNVAAMASMGRQVNQTLELLARMEKPEEPSPDDTPDVQLAAAAAREHLRHAVTRAIERRERRPG
jgi:hypothetical protein